MCTGYPYTPYGKDTVEASTKNCQDVAIVEVILLRTELANIVERPTVKRIGHHTSLKREATKD